jgi:hypothetical protein
MGYHRTDRDPLTKGVDITVCYGHHGTGIILPTFEGELIAIVFMFTVEKVATSG